MKLIRKILVCCSALLLVIIGGMLACGCSCKGNDETSDEDIKLSLMGKLKSCSELVTTRLQLRSIQTICIDNGNISLNPATWHMDRLNNIMVILPLDVTVNYGYNLDKMQVDIVKTDNDMSEVWVYLPDAEIISSTYNPRVPNDIEVIPSDGNPSQGQISRGMQIAYKQVIRSFDAANYRTEAENNAKSVFENILKNIDFRFTEVHIANIKDKH